MQGFAESEPATLSPHLRGPKTPASGTSGRDGEDADVVFSHRFSAQCGSLRQMPTFFLTVEAASWVRSDTIQGGRGGLVG